MLYSQMTPMPNELFDRWMPLLAESELKVLLVVVRQTLGWKDRQTGLRKARDRISGSQFRLKTGLSKRVVTVAVEKLRKKDLIRVTDYNGNILHNAMERKGKSYLFYSVNVPAHIPAASSAQSSPNPAQICDHNKTKRKEVRQKPARGFSGHASDVIARNAIYGMAVKGEHTRP